MANAATVYRDYITDGVPSSGANKPKKPEIRTLLTSYEGIITAFTSNGGLIYSSLALLNADLAHAANSMAWVIGDPVAVNNGVYGKVGASGVGSWTRRSDLPFSFIVASDIGAGTPNAIQATTSIPVSGSALIWMNIADTNGAGPTTVQFNGTGTVYTIKTNSGYDPSAGGLVSGMIVLGVASGMTFRLVSDQASAAIVAAAEAAADRAELAAASIELPGIVNDTFLGTAGSVHVNLTPAQARTLLGLPTLRSFGAVGDGVADDSSAVGLAAASGIRVDGQGLIYRVNSKPASFKGFYNCAFKIGQILYPTRDVLRTDTAKITNGLMYNGWAQDKCYKAGYQLRVWVNEKESHPDGTGRIALYFSDDGGASYSAGEYLNVQASGRTLWSAGYDVASNTEYLIVRVPSGSNDQPPYTYEVWKRVLGTGNTQNFNGTWTVSATTFPVPSGFTGQPVMVHSFTSGHGNSIVVGASYGEGAAVMRSTDGGATWTAKIIGAGTHYEEPTVKYHAASNTYCGFTRSGSALQQPSFWKSTDSLATVTLWDAPAGFFNGGNLSFSSISCDISATGILHAYTGYRTGVTEGAGTDERVSNFYMRGPIADDFFNASTTQVFCLGQIPRREPGGSSSLGNSSVVVDGDKVHLFYTIEEREGVIGGFGKGNRVADIAQTVIFLEDYGGAFDTRADLLATRYAGTQLRKAAGMDAFTVPFRDAANWPPAILISGRQYTARNPSSITIASDAITIPANTRFGSYVIDTEASAANDNLANIVDAAAVQGDQIILRTNTSSRDVVVKHGTGNIMCGADKTLGTAFDRITLEFDGANWVCISFQQNST